MTKQTYLVKLNDFEFDAAKPDSGWLHVFSLGSVHHPIYGSFEFTPERIQNFADNVNNSVLGTEVPIDYSHGRGPDGERAAGWSTTAAARSDGLWLLVDWTPQAAQEIRDKKWKYASGEFTDTWTDQQGHTYTDVLLASAITNRPFLKNLTPINLSDYEDDPEVYAEYWDDYFVQELADVDSTPWDGNAAMTACKSAADYRAICAGRREGDPSKRETWALPHHKRPGSPPNAGGVRNALSRLPQTQGLVNKDGAQRHLEAHMNAIRSMSDGGEMDTKVLAAFFGLGENASEEDVLAKAKEAGAAFVATRKAEEKAKAFAEAYPEEAARMEQQAKELSDLHASNRLSTINSDIDKLIAGGVPTKFADDIRALRTELSDEADTKLSTLLQELVTEGLVPLTEDGSTTAGHEENKNRTFSEVISDLKEANPDWSQKQAYDAAAKQEPELAKAYVHGKGGE